MAARIRSWSVGSRKTFHHGTSAIEAASPGCANLYCDGTPASGRLYSGAKEQAVEAATTMRIGIRFTQVLPQGPSPARPPESEGAQKGQARPSSRQGARPPRRGQARG